MPAPSRPPIRAVTFDFWDTIVAAAVGSGDGMRRLQIERFAATLEAAGSAVSPGSLGDAFDANWTRFEERWVTNAGQHTPADSVDLIAAHVGLDLEPALREELIDGFRLVGEDVPLELGSGIDQALRSLQAAGVRTGIVCDVGLTPSPTLRRRLDELGLLAMFDAWSFSDESGWFKPAAEAFEPALRGLGVEAAATAHVGDSRRTDVAGARSLGMLAVRFTGFHDRPPDTGPEAHHVIDDHRSLPLLLDVA